MVYKQNSRTRDIFEELKLSIMQGMFKPRERLMERKLASQFRVSRTPIREALHKLERMGMVRIIPNQGATVADFSLKDIECLYQVRLPLEQLAGRLACERISNGELQTLTDLNRELEKTVRANDFQRMIETDQAFHLALIQFSRNPFLIKAIEDLRLRSYPISYYYWRSKEYLRASLEDHRKIIQALRKKDGRRMDTLIESQMNNSKGRYLKYIADF